MLFTKKLATAAIGLACLMGGVSAHAVPMTPGSQAIIGSWTGEGPGFFGVLTFLEDGRYLDAMVVDGDPAHSGVEMGAFSWDALTGAISATSSYDGNGDWGLSSTIGGTQYVTVTGDTAYSYQAACPSCGVTLYRVLPVPAPVSSVPEAKSYAMILAGLGLVGFVTSRRKSFLR